MSSDPFSITELQRQRAAAPVDARPKIWAFGGGKGGIGKSFITSNLAVCIAQLGYSVCIVDLDLGGANVHTCLGGEIPKVTLSDYIEGRVSNIQDIVSPSPIRNLTFVSGAEDSLKIANLGEEGRKRILEAIPKIKAQYVFLDLGAGTSNNTLDFFLSADQSYVVTTPEPTAIENAYRFIKSAYYRKLTAVEAELGASQFIDTAMNNKGSLGIKTPSDLLKLLTQKDPELGARLSAGLSTFKPQFIINQVRTEADRHIGQSMAAICRKYFGIPIEYIGHLEHDNSAWQALRRKRPIIIEYPSSHLARMLFGLAKQLVGHKQLKAVV